MNVSASFGDKLVCVSKEDYIRNSIRVFVNLVYSSFLNPKMHIPLERNSQSATAERLSAPNGKFVVS